MIRPYPVEMTANENRLFTIKQVAVLVDARGLLTYETDSDTACEVRKGAAGEPVMLPAYDRGYWHPTDIFRACQEALKNQWTGVHPDTHRIIKHRGTVRAKAKITNPDGLDELLIANVIGADGGRPYLTKQPYKASAQLERGNWTQAMRAIMTNGACESYKYRRALRSLSDVGLIIRDEIDPLKFEWTGRAYLPLTRDAAAMLDAMVA